MAIPASDSRATFDETTGRLDISPVLSAVLKKDTTILGLLGFGEPALAVKFFFNSDALNPPTVVLNEGGDFTAADVTMTVVDASKIAVGTLLEDTTAGKSEVVQVTAISGNDLTVTRGYGSTTAEIHSDSKEWFIVGQPKQQGDETITDISRARSQEFNRVQEFKQTVKIADQLQAEARNGIHPGVADEFSLQVLRRTMEMMVELNIAVLRGIRSDDASDSVISTMMGLIESINAAGGNINNDNVELDEKFMSDLYQLAWDEGADPRTVVSSAKQIRKFSQMNLARVRVAPNEKVAGTFVTKFLTEQGAELDLHMERYMKDNELLLLDIPGRGADEGAGLIELAAHKTRELSVEPLAKLGNATRSMISAGWSMRTREPLKAHAFAGNLKVPA